MPASNPHPSHSPPNANANAFGSLATGFPGAIPSPAPSSSETTSSFRIKVRPSDSSAASVLVVDDDEPVREVVLKILRSARYDAQAAASGEQAMAFINEHDVDVVVLDYVMEGRNGRQVLRWLQQHRPSVMVIMITGFGTSELAIDFMREGAFDYLAKPFDIRNLLASIERAVDRKRRRDAEVARQQELEQLVDVRTQELRGMVRECLHALGSALDTRDPETQEHAKRVVLYSKRIAETIGLDSDEMYDIENGAILHDIGKIGVPDSILFKPAALTDDEWTKMREHPTIGHRMLTPISFLTGALPVVRHHHEKFDGSGYPDKLAGEEIPIGARIFAVADALDAITSDRPYRKAATFEEAREEIASCAGAHFDPQMSEALNSWDPRADWLPVN